MMWQTEQQTKLYKKSAITNALLKKYKRFSASKTLSLGVNR